jgi:citrate synthase
MAEKQDAKLTLPGGKEVTLPVIVGTEDEHAVDIKALRADSGYITLDTGYMNTGSTKSAITYLDGEQGILRYRGYPIEELAEHSNFVEVATASCRPWPSVPSSAPRSRGTA